MDHDHQTVKHQSDEALESQIISARAALRHDVMLLEEKLSPGAMVDRRKRRLESWWGEMRQVARQRFSGWRSNARSLQQEVGQTMEHGMSESRQAIEETRSRLSETRAKAAEIPERAASSLRESRYSRPLLYAGLAFLAGWGISRTMPITRREEELASKVVPMVEEKAGPIIGEARTAATESAKEAMSQRER